MSRSAVAIVLIIAGAIFFGLVLLVRRLRPGVTQIHTGPASGVLSYVAAAFGILIGFVIVFQLGQVANARQAIGNEATSIGTAFDEAQLFPEVEPALQHALICYSLAVTEKEWPLLDDGSGAPEADTAYRQLVAAYGEGTQPAEGTFGPASATNSLVQIGSISTARETRLVAANAGLGPIMWLLLLGAGGFVLVLLFVVSTAARPVAQATLIGLAGVFTVALFLLVILLNNPYGAAGPLKPKLIEETTARMVALAPEVADQPCSFSEEG